MKRIFLVLLSFLCLLPLSGCYDYREINDTAMVAGIAVDKGTAEKYTISVEIVQPAESESTSAKGTVLSESGNSAEDCLKRLVNAATKELQFSHCKLIVFSDEIAKNGISSFVDYFIRDSEYRPDLFLAVVGRGMASDMLKVGEKEERIASYDYVSVIENSYKETGSVPPTKLYQFPMDGALSMLPVFSEKDGKYSVSGTNGFRNGKKYADIDLDLTQSVLLVSGEYRMGELQLYTDDGVEVPCQIQSVNVKKELDFQKTLTVSTTVECDILLTALPEKFDISTESGMKKTEETIAQLLTEKIKKDWETSVSEGFSDVFGLEVYAYRHKPRQFEQWKKQKESEILLNPHCKVELANFGISDERISE